MSVSSLGVVGMGNMGLGIAEVAASSGLRVVLCKVTAGDPTRGHRVVETSLDRAVGKGRITADERAQALARIHCTAELDELRGVDIVIESIVEELGAKQALLADLERRLGDDVVLASNTSSLPLAELAAPLSAPARFVGVHFFSPVPAMKLVEIAAPATTVAATFRKAEELVRVLGKTAVIVSDTPGLIVNRLLVPFLLDAFRALEAGVAPAGSIDLAMRLGCGHPVGPLTLADAIGLDIVLAMAQTLERELGDGRCKPPALLERLVALGHLGKKSGEGVWDYTVSPPAPSAVLGRARRETR